MLFIMKKIRTAYYRWKVMKAYVQNNNGLISDEKLEDIRSQQYSNMQKVWWDKGPI